MTSWKALLAAWALLLALVNADVACPLEEMQLRALEDLYTATGGNAWRESFNWLIDDPCGKDDQGRSNWVGVMCTECRPMGRRGVKMLALEWNSLSGTLPDSIGNLVDLEVLNLGTNNLAGELPATMGALTKLRVLRLSYNKISGKYPRSMYALSRLESIELQYNDIIANANHLLTASPRLETVLVRGNRGMSGSLHQIGHILSRMRNLRVLDVHWANVGGKLPTELFQLPSLEELVLSSNDVSGTLPDDINLPQLRRLVLADNWLSGTLPSSLGRSTQLRVLDLAKNFFSGSIPASFGRLSALQELKLQRNLLTGRIPSTLWTLENLEHLDLSTNELGSVDNPVTIPDTVGRLKALERLHLHAIHLVGTIPPQVGELHKLQRLTLFNNHLSGTLPPEIGQMTSIQRLQLRNNKISGSVPATIGRLTKMEWLELQDNRLEFLPPAISGCVNLTKLFLHVNKFDQPVPVFLGSLTHLEVLTLHRNRFFGKRWPVSFGRLLKLKEITTHDNRVDGDPWLRIDSGVPSPVSDGPYCEDLREYENGGLTRSYWRACGTRNQFFSDVLSKYKAHEWVETHGESFHVCDGKCKTTDEYAHHHDFMQTPRYADMFHVADKSQFAMLMQRMKDLKGAAFDFHPATFRMPFQLQEWKEADAKEPGGLWLLKPSVSCCGQKIRLVEGPDDPTFPKDLSNWILQRFIHPPFLFSDHKVVLRLFVMCTSVSPLRVYLFPDGDVFYSHSNYTIDRSMYEKRGYFISDYFFSKKQRDFFATTYHLFDELRKQGYDVDKIFNDIRDAIVKALIVMEPRMRQQQRETIAHRPSTFEIFGYDVLIDKNLKIWVCEVNTTPNLGLEINRPFDPVIHEEDFDLKTRLMEASFRITGILPLPQDHPNFAISSQEACEKVAESRMHEHNMVVRDIPFCPEDDFGCLTLEEAAMLKQLECEYIRRDEYEVCFPRQENAAEFLNLWEFPRREDKLAVYWISLRPKDPARQYYTGEHPTPWSVPRERPWRDPSRAEMMRLREKNHDLWSKHMDIDRWNTDEEGRMPSDEPYKSIINDTGAFDDEDGSHVAHAESDDDEIEEDAHDSEDALEYPETDDDEDAADTPRSDRASSAGASFHDDGRVKSPEERARELGMTKVKDFVDPPSDPVAIEKGYQSNPDGTWDIMNGDDTWTRWRFDKDLLDAREKAVNRGPEGQIDEDEDGDGDGRDDADLHLHDEL